MASPAAVGTTEPDWLAARRERAAALSEQLELPRWKGRLGWEFTDLSAFEPELYEPTAGGDPTVLERVDPLWAPTDGAPRIEQVDAHPVRREQVGAEAAERRAPVVLPLADAAARYTNVVQAHLGSVVAGDADPFVARNESAWSGGAFVYLPRGVRLDMPVVVTVAQDVTRAALNWRTLIVIEDGAEAEVWEQYLSSGEHVEGLFNAVTEISVGQNGHLRYVSGQGLSERSWMFGTQRAEVGRDASLDWVTLGFGSARGRVRMETNLAGPGADAKVTGAYATHARQHVEFDTTQEHAAPNTTSDLAFRGVLAGRSSGVWRGMIRVDPGAQQTDAFQESRNLLLSKRAHADAIPGLEILANDVRCTHAAAIAQIDKDQLFYLMSHGLPREQATRLVIEGFLQELVERFAPGPVRDTLSTALERRLELVLGS